MATAATRSATTSTMRSATCTGSLVSTAVATIPLLATRANCWESSSQRAAKRWVSSTAIPTADDTLVASSEPISTGTADPRDAFLDTTRAPTDADDGLTEGPVTNPSEVDDSIPNTDVTPPAATIAEAEDIELIEGPEPVFDQAPADSFEQSQVEFASFDSAAADTDTFAANEAFVEHDEFLAEEMSSDV